jgi:hypothetical protein
LAGTKADPVVYTFLFPVLLYGLLELDVILIAGLDAVLGEIMISLLNTA